MAELNLRELVFSEFETKVQSTRSAMIQAHKIAMELLRHRKLIKKYLPRRRLPSYKDFRRLVYAVHGRSRSEALNVKVYQCLLELRIKQQDHKNRVTDAKSSLNTREERRTLMDKKHISMAFIDKQLILRRNLEVLSNINEVHRIHGGVDCYNFSFKAPSPTNVHIMKLKDAALIRENKRLGCLLLRVKSKVNSRNYRYREAPHASFGAPPEAVVRKYSSYFLPSSRHTKELLRPIIYFDLAVHKGQFLGRIIIQLFTEVSPEVVLEFVRLANTNNVLQAHKFLHIFPDLWMEGILVPHSRDALENHHYNCRSPLDATQQKGVLSYSWNHRHSFPKGLLLYTISFKTLAVMPLDRIIFGRVLSGVRWLELCREFGTKTGRFKKYIEVIECGLH